MRMALLISFLFQATKRSYESRHEIDRVGLHHRARRVVASDRPVTAACIGYSLVIAAIKTSGVVRQHSNDDFNDDIACRQAVDPGPMAHRQH